MAGVDRRRAKTSERQQASIRIHKPWEQATGPRTDDGKKKSAQNGCLTRRGNRGISEMRREMAAVAQLIHTMRDDRRSVLEVLTQE